MPNFELLEHKIAASNLAAGDHIMLKDMLWRVVDNLPVIGGSGRMLVLAYHTHYAPKGFKFHQVEQHDQRFEILRKIQD
jgi:hypothetical protein